jgi:hypothetical protein
MPHQTGKQARFPQGRGCFLFLFVLNRRTSIVVDISDWNYCPTNRQASRFAFSGLGWCFNIDDMDGLAGSVEALFKLADAIEKRVAAATARAEKLTQTILAKAFRGELVPTEAELARREGRSYEPASILLERIRLKNAPRKLDIT